MKLTLLASVPMVMLLGGAALPGCAQQPPPPSPTPRPDTPGASRMPGSDADADAEQQLKAMQEIHQRMMNARTPQERRALMAEHSRIMRRAMETMHGMQGRHGSGMQGMHGSGMGHGAQMQGAHLQRQMAMMQMMMKMMMDRIDMLDPPK